MRSLDRPERLAMDALSDACVLVVEDEWLLRAAVAAFLRDDGFAVVEAADADEALAALAEGGIDIVFTDIHMPGSRSGLELAAWIHEFRAELPVIVTSGKLYQFETDGLGAVAGALMMKPYSPAAVARRLRETLAGVDAVSSAA